MVCPHDNLVLTVSGLTQIFAHRKLKYALIGGLALSQQIFPRYTKDIDFLIDVPVSQMSNLLEDIQAIGGVLDASEACDAWQNEHMLSFHLNGIRVDWLKPFIPAYAHVIEHAYADILLDQSIRIAAIEGLILLKLLAFSDMDKLDVASMVAAKRETLNLAWIDTEWQAIGELSDPPMVWFKQRYHHITTGGS